MIEVVLLALGSMLFAVGEGALSTSTDQVCVVAMGDHVETLSSHVLVMPEGERPLWHIDAALADRMARAEAAMLVRIGRPDQIPAILDALPEFVRTWNEKCGHPESS